jgi:hypothetical protein
VRTDPVAFPGESAKSAKQRGPNIKTRRQCLLLILLLAVVCCFVLAPGSSASADPFLDGKIKVQLDRISSWEKTGQIVGWLIFIVFFLGVVVSALQAAKTRAMKITAGALSLLSAVIVGFYHQFYAADDRAYARAARQARRELDTFTLQLEHYSSSDLDKATTDALHEKFGRLIEDVNRIEDTIIFGEGATSGTEKPLSPALILLPSAQAQPPPGPAPAPGWATKPPQDQKNLYFVGNASGKTFEEARQNALVNGRNLAQEMFTKNAKESASLADKPQLIDQLAKALAGATEIAETFIVPDPRAGGYRSYVLLRLSRNAAGFTAESIFVQASVPYDKPFLDRIQK